MTATITAATGRATLTRGAQAHPVGTRASPGSQWAPPAAGIGASGVPVLGVAAALWTGAMGMTTWGTGCHRGPGGTKVVEVGGVAVALVMDGVVGIREDLQDGITEVLLAVL